MDSLSDECSPDEPNEAVPKIRVSWSDGTGTALWDQRTGAGDRTWFAPPAADHTESLYASESGMFLRCFHSKHPQLSGSAGCSDLFDADSYAVRCTPAEAVEWLRRHGYGIPDDLSRDVESEVGSTPPADKAEQDEGIGGKGTASQTTRWDRARKWALNNWLVVGFLAISAVVTGLVTLGSGLRTLLNWIQRFFV